MFNATRRWTPDECCRSWNTRWAGKPALNTPAQWNGHLYGSICSEKYRAHRVAWAMHYGVWPENEIDHIDRDVTNNRISNLRDVQHFENKKNLPLRVDNTSGVKGVCWDASIGRWRVRIGSTYVGTSKNKSEAIAMRRRAEHKENYDA